MPQHLLVFTTQYQESKIRIHHVIADKIVAVVQRDKARFANNFAPGEFDDLHFETLFNDELLAVFPDNHNRKQAKKLTEQQLNYYPFITLQRPSGIRLLI